MVKKTSNSGSFNPTLVTVNHPVPKETYARFKAITVDRGMTLWLALTLALELFIDKYDLK